MSSSSSTSEPDKTLPPASRTYPISVSYYSSPPSKASFKMISTHTAMSPTELGSCISNVFKDKNKDSDPICGLYNITINIFTPLSHIITYPSEYVDVKFSIISPAYAPVIVVKTRSYMNDPKTIIIVISGFILAYTIGLLDKIISWLISVPMHLADVIIETPIKQIYRNGPSLIGWEGLPLAQICSRVTYHGDADFWRANGQECVKIYNAKESAVLIICKPLCYAVVAIVSLKLAHEFVKAAAKTKPDVNMVETYKAFKILKRQLK